MSTARIESDSDSDSDSEYHDTNNVIETKKISRFYFDRDEVSFDEVWGFQRFGGGVYYLDNIKMAKDRLTSLPDQVLILHQYDIPDSDEEQQKKMYAIYEKTKGFNGEANAFGAALEMRPCQIQQFKYYSGYWEYSRNDKASGINITFHPCDPHEKDKFLTSKKELALQYDDYFDEIVKTKHNINHYTKVFRLSLTLAIAAWAFSSPNICLALSLSSFISAALLNHNVNQNRSFGQEFNKLQNAGGLLASSIFAEQKKIPNENHAATPRKPYGPQ